MIADLEALLLKFLRVVQVFRVGACLAIRIALAQRSHRPNRLCRAESEVGKKWVNVFAGFPTVAVGIIENREGERLTLGPGDFRRQISSFVARPFARS